MANNFFLNQDPLLFNQHPQTEDALRRQLNDSMMQYKMLQQGNTEIQGGTDYVGNLDTLMKSVGTSVEAALMENAEYKKLNAELTDIVQKELMSSVRWHINSNPAAVKNIERQMEMITETKGIVEDEQRRNLNELNDYVKNYSNITFEEYKKIKNGTTIENKQVKKQTKK